MMRLESYSEIDAAPGRYVFVRDTEPFETDGKGHKEGDVIQLDAASADRWARRDAVIPESDAPSKRDVQAANKPTTKDDAGKAKTKRAQKPRKA